MRTMGAACMLAVLAVAHGKDTTYYYEGDEVPYRLMRESQNVAEPASATTRTATQPVVFDIDGNQFTSTPTSYPFNENSWKTNGNGMGPTNANGIRRFFSRLSFANSRLIVNNLGNNGPNNGNMDRSVSPATQRPHQYNFIMFRDVSVLKDGTSVSLRIDNSTTYKPWDVLNNDFYGSMFQTNLQPLFDVTGRDQAFRPSRYERNSNAPPGTNCDVDPLNPTVAPPGCSQSFLYSVVVEDSLGLGINDIMDLDAANSNSVSLFYQFFNENTGAPVVLEETMIGFFDFDQAWADGDKGLVRESMMITDFEAVLSTAGEKTLPGQPFNPNSPQQLQFSKAYLDEVNTRFPTLPIMTFLEDVCASQSNPKPGSCC